MKPQGTEKNEVNNVAQAVPDKEKCCQEEGNTCCPEEEAFAGLFPGCKCQECPSAEVCKSAFRRTWKVEPSCAIDFSNVVIEPLIEDFVDFDTFSKSDFRAVKVKDCEVVKKSKKLLQFTLNDGTGIDRTILSGIYTFYEPEELVGVTCIAITSLLPEP